MDEAGLAVDVDVTVLKIAVEEALSNARKVGAPCRAVAPTNLRSHAPECRCSTRVWQYREPGTHVGVRASVRTEGGSATLLVEVDNANQAGAALLTDEECDRAFAFGAKEHTASASSDGIGLGNVSPRFSNPRDPAPHPYSPEP